MKQNIFLLLFWVAITPIFAQADTKSATPVTTKIEQVTVFLQGAQIQRKGSAMLAKGRNEFVFKGLSPFLDKESIRLKGDGTNFTVLSVNYTVNFLDEQQKRTEVTTLESQNKSLQQQIELENLNISIWQYEINSLVKNDAVSSTQNGVKTTELKELMEYRTARLRETTLKVYESNQKIKEFRENQSKIAQQLAEINAKSSTQTGEITFVANAETGGTANFDISYSVAKAAWMMSYDLRVKDVASPMNLLYKANVQQQTGEDWKDVKLVFSTGNPNYNHTPPMVKPWYLRDLYASAYEGRGISMRGSRESANESDGVKVQDDEGDVPTDYKDIAQKEVSKTATTRWVKKRGDATCLSQNPDDCMVWVLETVPAEFKQKVSTKKSKKKYEKEKEEQKSELEMHITENITNTLYEVGLPYTVLNDGKTYTAEIKTINVPASYEYYTAPKLSTDAYLTALVTNWDELQLIQGEASLYYEGTYMGKTALNPDNTNDTLRISLGIDKGIVVQRTKLKEYAKKQFFSDKQSEERAYEIAIRNRKSLPINIIIDDQFPLSPEKEISVENIAYKDAKLDEKTGKLTWKQTIEPAKERKFILHYKIKYPKSRTIRLDE